MYVEIFLNNFILIFSGYHTSNDQYEIAKIQKKLLKLYKKIAKLLQAWKNWTEGTASNVMDPTLKVGSSNEIMRCIHIGLLCVQENVASRPTMASVVLMLTSSSISLPVPLKPAFFMHSIVAFSNSEITVSDQSQSRSVQFSVDEASITESDPLMF